MFAAIFAAISAAMFAATFAPIFETPKKRYATSKHKEQQYQKPPESKLPFKCPPVATLH